MKTAAVLSAVALAAAVAAETALADGLPTPTLPSVPTVPVSVPPVSVPPVSVPQLPVSAPTTSTHVATPPSVTQSTPSMSITAGGVSVQTSSSGTSGGTTVATGGGTGAASSSSGAARSRPRIARFRSSRSWLAQHGPANRRHTILNFQLPAASRVIFSVTQIAPVCRAAGRFAVAGKEGLNRIVFRGRVNGRDLAPGTYKITARIPGVTTVLHAVVGIVDAGIPSPSELALARKSDVCNAAARGLASSSAGTVASASGMHGEAAPSSSGKSGGGPASGTAGESFTAQTAAPFSPERVAKNARNPLVIFALAAAILLLGLAALPKAAIPDPRLTDVLVRNRVEVALAGAAALAAALIALALA